MPAGSGVQHIFGPRAHEPPKETRLSSSATAVVSSSQCINAIETWVDTMVIGLGLCPFAQREILSHRVRFCMTPAIAETELMAALRNELTHLINDESIETTLLIHPNVLHDFHSYNQFLNVADDLLVDMALEGTFQIASFHPQYQFAGTEPDDAENYINRSPYPILQLLREARVADAVYHHPNTQAIVERNIMQMNKLGLNAARSLLNACYTHNQPDRV